MSRDDGEGTLVSSETAREHLDRVLAFFRRAARFYRPALALLGAGLMVTVAFDGLRKRTYRSETVLEYREPLRLAGSAGSGEAPGDAPRKLGARLKESLLSRVRLARIIKELRLYPKLDEHHALDELPKHVGFRANGDTFAISFDGHSPETTQRVVTRMAAGLLEDDLATQKERATLAHDFLVSESARNEAGLDVLEATAGRFMVRNPEFGQSGPVAASLVPAPQPATRESLIELRPAGDGGAYLAVQLEAAQQGPVMERQASRVASRQAAAAIEQATGRDLAEKVARFTDNHPDVIAARHAHDKALEVLQAANAEVTAGAADALRERLTAVRKIAGTGRGSSEPRRSVTPASPPPSPGEEVRLVSLATRWAQLSRDIADARERRAQLAQKIFVSSLMLSSVAPHLLVVDPAYLPRDPLPPGHALVLALGGLAALVLALGLALGCALLDDRLYDRTDLVRLGVGSLAASMPRRDPDEIEPTRERPATAGLPRYLRRLVAPTESAQSASFRVLRFRLAAAGDPRIIVVASATTEEDSSDCAVNLAAAIAEQGQARVILVDATNREHIDLQTGPTVTAASRSEVASEASEAPGPRHALTFLASAPRAAVPLHFITLPRLRAGESLDGAAFARSCRGLLEGACDYVVIDAPAVLGSADANVIAQAADGVVIAARTGRSSARAVHGAADQLAPIPILGVTLLPS